MPSESFFLSVLSLGEIREGVETLGPGKRKQRLIAWLEHDLPQWFGNRVVHIDAKVVDRWGILCAQSGRSVPAIDSLLAATALAYNLTMVTRNVGDFDFADLVVVNPWDNTD